MRAAMQDPSSKAPPQAPTMPRGAAAAAVPARSFAPPGTAASTRTASDWILFAALSLIWAGAYAFNRLAVSTGDPASGLPATLVLPGRLGIGAAILLAVMFAARKRFPPLRDRRRWAAIAGMGFFGMVGPFFLITVAQGTVDSSLAALYTAASPIFVSLGAALMFADEPMTARRALGIAVGFGGVVVLFLPDLILYWGEASTVSQALLLLATVFYSVSTLLARGAPKMDSLVFATGFVCAAAVMSLPLLLFVSWESLAPSRSAVAGVVLLGILPSALASLLYMQLVQQSSATFVSLTGYSIPVLSAVIGWLAFREVQSWNALAAFVLILGGVWLAQSRARDRQQGLAGKG